MAFQKSNAWYKPSLVTRQPLDRLDERLLALYQRIESQSSKPRYEFGIALGMQIAWSALVLYLWTYDPYTPKEGVVESFFTELMLGLLGAFAFLIIRRDWRFMAGTALWNSVMLLGFFWARDFRLDPTSFVMGFATLIYLAGAGVLMVRASGAGEHHIDARRFWVARTLIDDLKDELDLSQSIELRLRFPKDEICSAGPTEWLRLSLVLADQTQIQFRAQARWDMPGFHRVTWWDQVERSFNFMGRITSSASDLWGRDDEPDPIARERAFASWQAIAAAKGVDARGVYGNAEYVPMEGEQDKLREDLFLRFKLPGPLPKPSLEGLRMDLRRLEPFGLRLLDIKLISADRIDLTFESAPRMYERLDLEWEHDDQGLLRAELVLLATVLSYRSLKYPPGSLKVESERGLELD